MAYESDDICPSVVASEHCGEKASDSARHEDAPDVGNPEMAFSNLRSGDGDLYPGQPPPRCVKISRPPDSTAGHKNDLDHVDDDSTTKRGEAFSPLLWIIKWGLGGVLVLWLYFNLAKLLNVALECQDGWRYVALALFAIPVIVLAYVVARFCLVFRKMPRCRQVKGDLHTHDIAQKVVLKGRLGKYISDLKSNKGYVAVFESRERQREVSECIGRLCDDSRYSDAGGWIVDFGQLLKYQEDRAYGVVKSYCKLIALKTAACPWKAIDMVIVFVNLTLMVEKIARVYNRSVSRGGAFRLLCHWFANIYISGDLGALTEGASDNVAAWLTNGGGVKSGIETVASATEATAGQAPGGADLFSTSLPILSKFVGKAAEGAINAFLAYRMGKRAIEEFQLFVQSDK